MQATLAAFQDTKYKASFDWVDHLAEVTDPKLRDTLNLKMAKAFGNRSFDNMHLAASSIIDWENVDKFKISGAGGTEFLDLDIEEYADALGDKLQKISLDQLKTYKIRAQFVGSDTFFPQGSVYTSLVWETKYKNRFFAFVDGHWYEVDSSFANKVADFISKIPTQAANLLPSSHAGEKEGDYNKRVAASSTDLFLFDRKCVKPDGAATKIEFCDIFSKSKQLIHIKRKTQSATLRSCLSNQDFSFVRRFNILLIMPI